MDKFQISSLTNNYQTWDEKVITYAPPEKGWYKFSHIPEFEYLLNDRVCIEFDDKGYPKNYVEKREAAL